MVRHLHDIAPLISVIREDEELFVDVADSSFEGDRQTGKRDTQAPVSYTHLTLPTILLV